MKGRWLWMVIGANLLVVLALAFIYPHLMVSPGPLVTGHASLATDCFACHTPFRGASAARCTACHAPRDIGLRTTKGLPLTAVSGGRNTLLRTAFHQELTEQNCMACHSDHARPKLTQRSRKSFSHTLLRVETRSLCSSCHVAPGNEMHAQRAIACAQCHRTDGWKPATFEHEEFFRLDQDHNVACRTCHTSADYSKYSCYGCHEHTQANVRGIHIGEGIPNFENCVQCHRNANREAEGRGERGGSQGHSD